MKSPVLLPTGDPTNPKPEPKAPQLSRGSIAQLVLGGFPNVVLGGRTPGAASRAARAPLSRPGGL